jgi:mRNA deadenylase 3'-5' endonuclease subunit Ccr4
MTFSMVSWNILADAYVKPERYPLSPPDALDPARRRAVLLASIVELDADVYCLQEVERPSFDAIAARLGEGYDGAFACKRGKPDGSALLVRRGTFELARTETLHFAQVERGYNQLALFGHLRCAEGELAVVSTHLPWQGRSVPRHEHLGRLQFLEVLAHLPRFAPNVAATIAGDFNALSQSPVLDAAMERDWRLSCRAQRPWDTVSIGGRCRKLDYILYKPGQLTPRPGKLPKLRSDTAMPSAVYASDHLPVRVEFSFG